MIASDYRTVVTGWSARRPPRACDGRIDPQADETHRRGRHSEGRPIHTSGTGSWPASGCGSNQSRRGPLLRAPQKTFFIRYRPKGTGRSGPKRFLKIGDFGSVTPEQARDEARKHLGEVARGEDPAATQKDAKDAPTLSDLIDEYLEEVAPKKKPGTANLYTHYLKKLVTAQLKGKKAASITHADIAKFHSSLGKTKPVTANRTIAALSSLYTFAAKRKRVAPDFNPAKGLEKFKERARERYLTTKELGRLGDALHLAETDRNCLVGRRNETEIEASGQSRASPPSARPVCGCCDSLADPDRCAITQILHAKWDQIDFERGILFLETCENKQRSPSTSVRPHKRFSRACHK